MVIQICKEGEFVFDFRKSLKGNSDIEPCGKSYDDVNHSTICPHEHLPPAVTYPPTAPQAMGLREG